MVSGSEAPAREWSRADAASGALRAIDAAAWPCSWRTCGPRRLRRQSQPALDAMQGGAVAVACRRTLCLCRNASAARLLSFWSPRGVERRQGEPASTRPSTWGTLVPAMVVPAPLVGSTVYSSPLVGWATIRVLPPRAAWMPLRLNSPLVSAAGPLGASVRNGPGTPARLTGTKYNWACSDRWTRPHP